VLYEAVGRALMAWEEVECELSHLYSAFITRWPFDIEANRKYGEPLNFVHRAQALERVACRYFCKNPCQDMEGAFAEIMRLANGWSTRRNDVAHGRARPSHWILNPGSRETLLGVRGPLQWCIIPAHFKEDKFIDDEPTYVLTSPEMRRFAAAFWSIAKQTSEFMHKIEAPSRASYGRSFPLHFG
jgi:hypothetical protein